MCTMFTLSLNEGEELNMSATTFKSKRFLASALITSGLLGSVPLVAEEIIHSENAPAPQEKVTQRIASQLCNQQFRCNKTEFIIHFLPDSKALFIDPESSKTLKANYTIRFNRDVAINVYENPSKHFDMMMHDIQILPEGFIANVNREKRCFTKV